VISEAGMPGISDPGARAVAAAVATGARVEVIPGPNAAVAALVGSGLPIDRFTFLGFPPRESGARRELFGTLRHELGALVFYEAPDRVGETLADLAAALGADRPASLARELTKIHEEHVRGTLGELAARYADVAPRGECTLVVGAGIALAPEIDIEAELRRMLAEGLGPKDAAARLVVVTGKPRRQLYQLALSLQREREPQGSGQ
jgi:16S rRNA (cytidine1402-2'-O)-methyltransferase